LRVDETAETKVTKLTEIKFRGNLERYVLKGARGGVIG
jgi:hypothetical protein